MALCRAAPGDLDAGFGTSGKVNVRTGGTTNGRATALLPDGKIRWPAIAGHRRSSKNLFLLVRFTPGGAVDTSFGNNGVVSTMIGAAAEASWGRGAARWQNPRSPAAASPSVPLTQPSSVFAVPVERHNT